MKGLPMRLKISIYNMSIAMLRLSHEKCFVSTDDLVVSTHNTKLTDVLQLLRKVNLKGYLKSVIFLKHSFSIWGT